LHLATPEDFFAESFRVLRPGARLAFTVWAAPPATEAFDLILGAVKSCGNPDVPLPPGPPFFRYAETQAVQEALSLAGFSQIAMREVPQIWEVPCPRDIFVAFRDGTGRTAALLAGQTPAQLKAVEDELISGILSRQASPRQATVRLRMPCMLATATKS